MAGESKRFMDVGIMKPKWSIKIGDRSVLSMSIESLKFFRFPNEKIILILRSSQTRFLKESLQENEFNNVVIVYLDNKTAGQAETLLVGLKKIELDLNERLIVWCADAYITPDALNLNLENRNAIAVSKLPGKHWSFIKIKNDLVIKTAEKRRISALASVGLYEFDSVETFLKLKLIRQENQTEIYIAPLYNQLIENQKIVKYFEISPQNYYSFGTPTELDQSANRLGKSVIL